MDIDIFDLFGEEIYCSICLSDIKEGQRTLLLQACQHGFHEPCIAQWLLTNKTCPNCRKAVLEPFNNLELQRSILSWIIVDKILAEYKNATIFYANTATLRRLSSFIHEGQRPFPLSIESLSALKRQKQLLKQRILELLQRRSPTARRIRAVHFAPDLRLMKQVVAPRLQQFFLPAQEVQGS